MNIRTDLTRRYHVIRKRLDRLFTLSLFRPSLSGKLILLMSLGILSTSSALGWYLANNLVQHSRETLLKTGTILANNLASNGRYSVYTKDQLRLTQLIETALQTPEVVYVQFVGADGQIILRDTKGQRDTSVPHARTSEQALFPPAETIQAGLSSSNKILITPFHTDLQMEKEDPESLGLLISSWLFTSPFSETLYDFAVPIFRKKPSLVSTPSLSSLDVLPAGNRPKGLTPPSSQSASGLVQLGLSDAALAHELQRFVGQVFLITLLVILLGVTITIFLARRIITPLNSLTTMAQRITAGDYTVDPLPQREDEIGKLNAAFIHMLATLKERDAVVKSQIRCLQALHNVEAAISTATNEQTLIANVLDHIHKQAGFPTVLLGFFDAERHTLYGVEKRGYPDKNAFSCDGKEYFLETIEGKLGQVLCHRTSLVIKHNDELTTHSDQLLRQNFTHVNGCSCILSPLQSEQGVLGILAVESCPTWSEAEDFAFIHAVASQTGIAIDRLRAYTRLEEAKTTLESRVLDRTRELQVANEKLQEVDRLRAKFVAITSHELRTPLTTIKMFADNMLSGIVGPLEEKQKYYLSRLCANVQRLQRLIRDLLDLAQIESKHMKLSLNAVNLSEVIEEVVEELTPQAVTHGVKICMAPPPYFPIMFGDRDRVFQVLNNLVHNAIKFTGPEGKVTIAIEDSGNQDVQVCIADTGCGIPPEELKNIFKPYYRIASSPLPKSGVGLGLALTHELVALQHGKIWVESTTGKGSRFYVSFPAHAYSPTSVGS